MCLVVVAFNADADMPLIVAANRDEFHARPTQAADWWADRPGILAGRDLQAGGTWLGASRNGRFATVTNYRDAQAKSAKFLSRGHLVSEFLSSNQAPVDYLRTLQADAYAGFNLLLSDGSSLAYLSNRGAELQELPPGIYGLSNATLDTPWEKVERSKTRLRTMIDAGGINDTNLLRLLHDHDKGPVAEVKSSRLPFSVAHAITAPFIVTPDYGTRCSSIVRADRDGHWHFFERRFNSAGQREGDSQYSFSVAE